MHRFVRLAVSVAIAGVLAACGSSSSSGTYGKPAATPSSSGSVAASGGPVVTAKDFSFTPTTLAFTAGEAVTIKATNDGSAEHNLTIKGLGVNVDLPPGSTKTAAVAGAKAGTYEFHCAFHPTQMKGTVTVSG